MGACQRQRKSVLVQTDRKEMEGENDFITMCHNKAVNKCYHPSLAQWLCMVGQAHDKYILLIYLPLLQPTPHTRMFMIGWQCSRVWSKGSNRVRVSFFRTSIISRPCRGAIISNKTPFISERLEEICDLTSPHAPGLSLWSGLLQ